jgi:uracil-DNA glycosylase
MEVNIKTDWKSVIEAEQQKGYWSELSNLVDEAYNSKIVYPAKQNIFACFNYFNIKDTKVVIIGQDPYHQPNQANGLSFSVNDGTRIPKSLINIYKELKSDLNINRIDGDLKNWAEQGVLLLNNTLTVEETKPNSHSDFGWTEFTDDIIKYIDGNYHHVVFVLWGNFARTKKNLIKNNYIIESAHPSPLSAYNGFFGSKPFSKINNYLVENKIKPINW